MPAFLNLSTNGPLGLVEDGTTMKKLPWIQRAIAPHRFMEPNNVYGPNDIGALMSDPATDKSKWPKYTPVATNPRQKAGTEYYRNLLQGMTAAYMDKAAERGSIVPREAVVHAPIMFNLAKVYREPGIEPFSMPELYLPEDSMPKLDLYGYTIIRPIADRYTVKLNTQRYFYIETLARNDADKRYTVRVSDYAGNRFQWLREMTATFDVCLEMEPDGDNDVDPSRGPASAYRVIDGCGYEEFLQMHIPHMDWTKEQTAFWLDAYGIRPLSEAYIVNLRPSKKLLRGAELPDHSENGIGILIFGDDVVNSIRKISGMDCEIITKDDDAISAYVRQLSQSLFRRYVQIMYSISFELLDAPGTAALLAAPGEKTIDVGRMSVTAPGPVRLYQPRQTAEN